jgi:archaellum biogenesis ATPase FlaH
MIKNELINKSPLRILEQSIHGGMGQGNIGVIAACKGVGKTACLVHIATDRLFQGRHVIHVSFCSNTRHIISWYEDIFSELARRNNLTSAMDVHDDIIRNRIIMNFKQDSTHIDRIGKNIRLFLENDNFCVDTLVIDGYNFNKATREDFKDFRRLAQENNLELWFSASLKEDVQERGIPDVLAPFIEDITILIYLEPSGGFVRLTLLKDHNAIPHSDLHLKLDPQILLIAEENDLEKRKVS